MPTITAHEHPIRQIFSNEFAFAIPTYQRPYSWGTEQAGELFDDLLDASESFVPGTKCDVTPYFLGSVVLIKSEQSPDADVIDGQQRLTTLSLLLSALRVTFEDEKRKATFAALIFEEGDPLVGTKDRCRLTLRERDHTFYEKNILRHPDLSHLDQLLEESIPDPQRRLAQNAHLLRSLALDLPPERRDILAAYILQNTYLVVVSTPDLNSAFRIFSVLNDRGLNLSAADILKAEIIGKIEKNEQARFVSDWEDAEEELGTDKFTELFSHIRMIHGRDKLRKNVLDGVRDSVPLLKSPKQFIIDELIPSADAYRIILEADYDCSDRKVREDVNRSLALLSRLDDTDWVAPAIYFLTRKQGAPEDVANFLRDLERLAATMWIRGSDVNKRIRRYGELLAAIEAGSDLAIVNSPLQLSSGEKTETLSVLEGDIYHLQPKKKRTMVLLRLDSALSSGEATYDHERITVEHILPQNPADDSQWINWWPDGNEREAAVHRLGNLALLNRRQNSAASNWDFEEKKTKYFLGRSGSSPFALTTEVVARNEWKPEDFRERQQRFVDLLAKEWRL
jgi:hypothetical protein